MNTVRSFMRLLQFGTESLAVFYHSHPMFKKSINCSLRLADCMTLESSNKRLKVHRVTYMKKLLVKIQICM